MLKPDFLWGGASAANQYEGGYREGGRGLASSDVMTRGSKDEPRCITFRTPDGKEHVHQGISLASLPEGAVLDQISGCAYPSTDAVDFFHHLEEDLGLYAELGFKVYRMSISWSRIFPTGLEDAPNEEGLAFYDKVFSLCREHGIEPMVTLHHFEVPLELCNRWNAWLDRRTIDCFLRFCKTVFERYRDSVKYWITFNEINNVYFGFLEGGFIGNDEQAILQAAHNQLVASARAVSLGRAICPDFQFGCMLAASRTAVYPRTCNPLDVQTAWEEASRHYFFSDVQCRGRYPGYQLAYMRHSGIVIDMAEGDEAALANGTVDFISMSYYRSMISTSVLDEEAEGLSASASSLRLGNINPYLTATEWGIAIDPLGFRITLHNLYDRYQLPIMVVENGLGAVDELTDDGRVHDPYRVDFFRRHISAMKDAVEYDGVDVMGYTTWSPIDMVSAGTGEMRKRYGFVYVDADGDSPKEFKRIKKDSFDWYRRVIATNGDDLGGSPDETSPSTGVIGGYKPDSIL